MGNRSKATSQRLKEAVWRIEGLCSGLTLAERMPKYKFEIIAAELRLLADALGVPTLTQHSGK